MNFSHSNFIMIQADYVIFRHPYPAIYMGNRGYYGPLPQSANLRLNRYITVQLPWAD